MPSLMRNKWDEHCEFQVQYAQSPWCNDDNLPSKLNVVSCVPSHGEQMGP